MRETISPSAIIESVRTAVKTAAADCDTPTLVTLTGTGATITGRREATPGGPLTAEHRRRHPVRHGATDHPPSGHVRPRRVRIRADPAR